LLVDVFGEEGKTVIFAGFYWVG